MRQRGDMINSYQNIDHLEGCDCSNGLLWSCGLGPYYNGLGSDVICEIMRGVAANFQGGGKPWKLTDQPVPPF